MAVVAGDVGRPILSDWKKPGNWAALSGLWTPKKDACRFDGVADPNARTAPSLCLNASRLTDGAVQVAVKLARNQSTTGGVFFGYQSPNRPYVLVGLGAFDRAYSVAQYLPPIGFVAVENTGSIANLRADHSYRLRVDFVSQRIRVTVDEVQVLDSILPNPAEGTGWGLFAWDDAPIEFSGIELRTRQPQLFVAMPFREPYDSLYREVIEPVAGSHDLSFHVVRVDEVYGPGIVLEDIHRKISESHVVIAEVSEPNPNVFYELGYAHALHKPAILLAKRSSARVDLPFDIRPYRVVFYDDSIAGKKLIENTLRRHLEAILGDTE